MRSKNWSTGRSTLWTGATIQSKREKGQQRTLVFMWSTMSSCPGPSIAHEVASKLQKLLAGSERSYTIIADAAESPVTV